MVLVVIAGSLAASAAVFAATDQSRTAAWCAGLATLLCFLAIIVGP